MSAMAKKPARGGRRPGAGRPREVGEPFRLTIDYERADIEALRKVAESRGASVSSLIRSMVASAAKRARRRG